jgi:hypothetical protein
MRSDDRWGTVIDYNNAGTVQKVAKNFQPLRSQRRKIYWLASVAAPPGTPALAGLITVRNAWRSSVAVMSS